MQSVTPEDGGPPPDSHEETAMNATTQHDTVAPATANRHLLTTQIDGDCVTVRATAVWPIAEVLDFERHLDDTVDMLGPGEADKDLILDALDSRMIAAPRPGRRQRMVSSRAMFYAGG
jgi:hypothetical protein